MKLSVRPKRKMLNFLKRLNNSTYFGYRIQQLEKELDNAQSSGSIQQEEISLAQYVNQDGYKILCPIEVFGEIQSVSFTEEGDSQGLGEIISEEG